MSVIDLRDYRKGVVADLERCRASIVPFEDGTTTLRSRTLGEDWKDVTPEIIENTKATIATYEMILADLDRRIAEQS